MTREDALKRLARCRALQPDELTVSVAADIVDALLAPKRERCGSCGQFLAKTSYFANRCGDCWTPEDQFA